MSINSCRSALAFVFALAAVCLNGRAAHAQANAVSVWTSGWQTAFGGNSIAEQSPNPYGDLLAFSDRSAGDANYSSRYHFENGSFVGSERGGLGLGISGFGQAGTWGNIPSLSHESMQFGYNFKNSPVTVYAGFDTLKLNTAPLAGFDSMSATMPGYGVHAGVEFRPTSNLSLSLGVGYTQLPVGYDTGINSLARPGASSFAFGAIDPRSQR
jgi:opacity protein-like surface antigen